MPHRSPCMLLAALTIAAAWAACPAAPDLAPRLVSFTASPEPGAAKTISGEDDRRDIYAVQDSRIREWADSTCALVDASQLVDLGGGEFKLRTHAYTLSFAINGFPISLEPCDGEPFAGQPVAANCTGFVIGDDLIATAGHCVDDAFNLDDVRFIFGFRMLNASEANTRFSADRIYSAVEVIAGSNELRADDFAIVRVDRPITAPGAVPLPLRQVDAVPVGARVGVIGHPLGLPAKATFGASMVTGNDPDSQFFVTDIDAFGGNSGSPVFNADSGIVEGVLVRRSPTDDRRFSVRASGVGLQFCFASTVVEEGAELHSEATKTAEIDLVVHAGQLSLDKSAYRCEDLMSVFLRDDDLAGAGSILVTAVTGRGDAEVVALAETAQPGYFEGSLAVVAGDPVPESGFLEGEGGDFIVATYRDAHDGAGPSIATTAAGVDCMAPEIGEVTVEAVSGAGALLVFETVEMASVIVGAGPACGEEVATASGAMASAHRVTLGGLEVRTTYYATVEATDAAGNVALFDNGAACTEFTTTDERDFFTQDLAENPNSLDGTSLTLVPDHSSGGYAASGNRRTAFPVSPGCGTPLGLSDDSFARVTLDGWSFPFFGQDYDRLYVSSNGYLTFEAGDTGAASELDAHFDQPRIAPLLLDLHPEKGGTIALADLDDRIAVTYEDVPDIDGIPQSVQVELFGDGAIRMTWLHVRTPRGIVGISDGTGIPPGFLSSDLAAYPEIPGVERSEVTCDPGSPLACHGPVNARTPSRGLDAVWIAMLLVFILLESGRHAYGN